MIEQCYVCEDLLHNIGNIVNRKYSLSNIKNELIDKQYDNILDK